MLDIKYIREHPEVVKDNIKKKFQDSKLALVDALLEEDKEYRNLLKESEDLRAKRNKFSESINTAKKAGQDVAPILAEAKLIPARIKEIEDKVIVLQKSILDKQKVIPNIMHESVPVGKDDSENVEVARYGEVKDKGFEVKNHGELLEALNNGDFESARNTSGNGFYFIKGDMAELEDALRQYAVDFMKKKGYTYVLPPNMIKSEVVTGVMSFTEMDNMMYKIEGQDLYLIGTSEHSMIGMFMNKVLKKEALPIRIFGNTACYRKEIGSHGIDEKGVYRVHQFNKVEQIVICEAEDSFKLYEELVQNSIEIFQGLGLPIRHLEICSGDLADLKAKSADIEAWSPRKKAYFEVCSCTNMTDAQARRLNIKIDGGATGRYFAHTLNDTAIATSRAMVAIAENYQNADGTITVPEALRKYMNGKTKLQALPSWFW